MMSLKLARSNNNKGRILQLLAPSSSRVLIPSQKRQFSSSSKSNDNNIDNNNLTTIFQHRPRIHQIEMHSQSTVGNAILPGGEYVMKENPRTKEKRQVLIESAYGYFWMMKDLTLTQSKPVVTKVLERPYPTFPTIGPLQRLSTSKEAEIIELPNFILHDKKCTLVTISFREYGNKLLSNWTEPFRQAFGLTTTTSSSNDETTTTTNTTNNNFKNSNAVQVLNVNILDYHTSGLTGWFVTSVLKPLILTSMRWSIPQQQDREGTLVYIPSTSLDLIQYCDVLRMHNTLTCYLFLLDGLGRIRFVASGGTTTTSDEVDKLVACAKDIIKDHDKNEWNNNHKRRNPTRHNKNNNSRR